VILLISAAQVARITGMSHQHPACGVLTAKYLAAKVSAHAKYLKLKRFSGFIDS
jgi:hypothetical protein